MKVAAILGSPRLNGNSAFIAGRFLESAKRHGAETRAFALNALAYRGCQACNRCKRDADVCVQQDDLSEVLEAVRNADVLVLATPVYYGDVTGQMKTFIDRTYSYLTPDFHSSANPSRLEPGKTVVFIQTQGQADEAAFAEVFPRYREIMKFLGIDAAHLIRVCGLARRNDVCTRETVLKQAEELAATLVRRYAGGR